MTSVRQAGSKNGSRRRARCDEDKALRREGILRAAESLLDTSQGGLPSAADIAREAGLAKGTLYLYFQSKEEIGLSLLIEGLERWCDLHEEALREKGASIGSVAARYASFCAKNPRVLFLANLSQTILENNASEEAAYCFRKRMAERVETIAGLMAKAYDMPGGPREAARQLFRGYFLTIGLWRLAYPLPVLQRVNLREDMAMYKIDFETELRDAMVALWRGGLASG